MKRKNGLASIEDCLAKSIRGLEIYIKKSKEILITTAGNISDKIRTNRTTKTRKQK